MGMYDNIICEIPLQPKHNSVVFQTKSTPNQALDFFKIDRTGQLWEHMFDIAPVEKVLLWQKEHPTEFMPIDPEEDLRNKETMSVNKRWEKCTFTGTIVFNDYNNFILVVYSGIFNNGITDQINLLHRMDLTKAKYTTKTWPPTGKQSKCFKAVHV